MSTNKKLLFIFDLNKTLMLVSKAGKYKTFGPASILEERKPDIKLKEEAVFFRDGRNEFLDYIFMKNRDNFDVGVWSSLDADKTSFLAKGFFERYYRNLLFISATRREEYEGIKDSYSYDPLRIQKDLQQLFDKFPDYDRNNTVVVSNFPNMLEQFQMNDLLVPQYDPNVIGAKFQNDILLHGLMKFMKGLKYMTVKKEYKDIRTILNAKSLEFMLDRIENTNSHYEKFL